METGDAMCRVRVEVKAQHASGVADHPRASLAGVPSPLIRAIMRASPWAAIPVGLHSVLCMLGC